MLFEVLAKTRHGAAGADAHYDGIDVAAHLLEDFWRCRQLVRQRIVGIAELVDEVESLLFGNTAPEVLVVLGVTLGDIGSR